MTIHTQLTAIINLSMDDNYDTFMYDYHVIIM